MAEGRLQHLVPIPSELEKEPERPVTLWDRDDPNSIFNKTDSRIGKRFEELYLDNRDYFELDEDRLYKRLCRDKRKPTPTDNRLRYAFWQEYDRCASKKGVNMMMTHVYGGICTKEYFYNVYLGNPARLVWFLCPPTSYEVYAEEALNFGMSRIRKMLSYDDFTIEGKPDHKMMELKCKIVKMLDERKHGLAVARTAALNVNVSDKHLEKKITEGTMTDIDERLRKLEIEDKIEANGGKPVMDIEVDPS